MSVFSINVRCRKDFSRDHASSSLMENWKNIFADKGFDGVVLKDLSTAFVTLNRELLIAKLIAYGFTNKSLRLI